MRVENQISKENNKMNNQIETLKLINLFRFKKINIRILNVRLKTIIKILILSKNLIGKSVAYVVVLSKFARNVKSDAVLKFYFFYKIEYKIYIYGKLFDQLKILNFIF